MVIDALQDICLSAARHNRSADREVIRLLNRLSDGERMMNRGSYFGGLIGIFRHLTVCGGYLLSLLDRISDSESSPKPERKLLKLWEQNGGFEELSAALTAWDEQVLTLCGGLNERILSRTTAVPGKTGTFSFSRILLQHTVHQNYHRGQISHIFDELNIEHDLGSAWDSMV